MTSIKEVVVLFPTSWDLGAWTAGYLRGEVPSRLPYGFDLLGEYLRERQISVSYLTAPKSWRVLKQLLSPDKIYVAWDEHTAARILLRTKMKVGCGIIWACDPPRSMKERLVRPVLRVALKRASFLWCLSRPQLDKASSWLGFKAGVLNFLPFGVDTNFFRHCIKRERKIILSVGNDRDRDPVTLMRALSLVRDKMPDVKGIVQTPVDVQAADGVRVVRQLSHVELRDLYSKAAVCVVATKPNLHVSGMTVSLEAMSSGCPVVITGTPGIEDYVRDGLTGFVTPLGEPEALATRILEVLSDQKLAHRLISAGGSFVRHERNTSSMMRDLASMVVDGIERESLARAGS